MSERILVTGATSAVGSELVRLLRSAGRDVKAGTRHPDRAVDRFDSEVEVVELDYARPATFDAAVEWADRLFLQPPSFASDAHETVAPLLDWAVQAGTEHVVCVTAMGMELRDDRPLRRLESHIGSLGVDFTFLRPNFYMQSFTDGPLGGRIRRTGAYAMPVERGTRVSVVDARDVAAVAAAALTDPQHLGASYTLTGPEALTHEELARMMTEATGRTITFGSCTDEEMFGWLVGAGWPRDEASAVISLYQSVRGGVRAAVTDDVRTVLGRGPTSFADFAMEHVEAWRA